MYVDNHDNTNKSSDVFYRIICFRVSWHLEWSWRELHGSISFKLFCDSDFKWENEMSEQTKQSHATLLCILAMLAGLMVVSGAATRMVTFLWDGLVNILI